MWKWSWEVKKSEIVLDKNKHFIYLKVKEKYFLHLKTLRGETRTIENTYEQLNK